MKEQMKKGGLVCLVLFVIFQLIKVGLADFMLENYGVGRIEAYPETKPAVINVLESEGYATLKPVLMNQQKCSLLVKEEVKVLGVGTNSYFPMLEPLLLQDGAFFGETATNAGRNVVVISDVLSKQLFGSVQVTGNICKIDNIPYQIIGVYTKYKNALDSWFDLGEEVIYFPISSEIGKKVAIDACLLPTYHEEKRLEEKDLLTLGISEENSLIDHAEDAYDSLQGLITVAISFITVVLVGYCCRLGIKDAKNPSLSHQQKGRLLISYFLIGGAAVLLGLKRFYIPTGLLPPYNIFDLNYYWQYFKKQLMLHHQLVRVELTYFETFYWQVTLWSLLLTLGQILLSFPISKWFLVQLKSMIMVISKPLN